MDKNYSTHAQSEQPKFDVEMLCKAIEQIGDDPLAALMKEHGCDPKKGGRLLVNPETEIDWGLLGKPYYVLGTQLIDKDKICLVNTFSIGNYIFDGGFWK